MTRIVIDGIEQAVCPRCKTRFNMPQSALDEIGCPYHDNPGGEIPIATHDD